MRQTRYCCQKRHSKEKNLSTDWNNVINSVNLNFGEAKKYDDFQTICVFNLFLYNLHVSPVKGNYSWQVCHCDTKNNCWTHCCHRFYHSLVAVVAIGWSSKLYFFKILNDMTRKFYRESACRYQIYNFNRDSQTDNKSSVGRLLMLFDDPWL